MSRSSLMSLLQVGSLLLSCGAKFFIVAKKKPRDARGAVVVVPQSAVKDEVEGAGFRFFEGGHFCFLRYIKSSIAHINPFLCLLYAYISSSRRFVW